MCVTSERTDAIAGLPFRNPYLGRDVDVLTFRSGMVGRTPRLPPLRVSDRMDMIGDTVLRHRDSGRTYLALFHGRRTKVRHLHLSGDGDLVAPVYARAIPPSRSQGPHWLATDRGADDPVSEDGKH